jgi:hypothetical protein
MPIGIQTIKKFETFCRTIVLIKRQFLAFTNQWITFFICLVFVVILEIFANSIRLIYSLNHKVCPIAWALSIFCYFLGVKVWNSLSADHLCKNILMRVNHCVNAFHSKFRYKLINLIKIGLIVAIWYCLNSFPRNS